MSNFSIIINVEFTALVERELDRVNDGEISWETVVGNVYDSFKDSLIIQRGIKIMPSGKDVRERDLGSLGGESIILKDGKFGPYVSYKKKNRGLSYLLKDIPTEYDDITLDFIKDYIQYPLSLGKHDGSQVMIHIGPYGKYMKYGKRNIKIPQNAYYELEACIRLIPRY
jgi:DNA topoisomerase-1